jgi:WD40 repeat protein
MAFSSDGKKCACVTRDYNTDMTFDTIYVWDTQTGKLIKPLHGHTADIKQIAFSPICDMLASVSSDNTVRLWNTENGQEIGLLEGNIDLINSMYSMSFTPDGKNLTCLSLKAMHIMNIRTNEWSILQKIPGDHLSHKINPDGSSLITVDFCGKAYLWKQYTQQLCTIINQHEQVFLLNAIRDWDENKPHIVAPENRAIYKSLIERFAFLNNPELFKTTDPRINREKIINFIMHALKRCCFQRRFRQL